MTANSKKSTNIDFHNQANLIKAGKIFLQIIRRKRATFDHSYPNPSIRIEDLETAERCLSKDILGEKVNQDRSSNSSQSALTDYIFNTTTALLKNKDRVTIKKIIQTSGFPEATVRSNIQILVNSKKLSIIPGIGRKPAYLLPPIAIKLI